MERFIFCFFVALLSFAASSVNAAYSTLASASTSLSAYGIIGNGVLIASRTLTGPTGIQYNIYAAVTSDGRYCISVKSNTTLNNTSSQLLYFAAPTAVHSSPLVSGWFDLGNTKSGSFYVDNSTPWYFFQPIGPLGSEKYGSIFTIHFPVVPSASELIETSSSLSASGSAVVHPKATAGGKVYTQVRFNGVWQTVQIQPAPASNSSATYTSQDVETWLGTTVGVDAIRAVTYTSTGAYYYNDESLFSGSGAYVWATSDNDAQAVTSLPDDSVRFPSAISDYMLSYDDDGTLSYGVNGTGTVVSNSQTVSVLGTATDTLTASNVQTGLQRQTLAATASGNATLAEIASDVDTIAENSDSSAGSVSGGGLSDADSALLENIDKNVQDAADRQAAFDEMTGYDREDSMADILDDASDALVSAVSGAQDTAASALASQGLAGSDQSAGNTSPSGASNFWQINLPWGAQLKFDPADVSEIATILYAVRAALGWIFLGWFFQWFVPRLREAYQTVILTPTPVANTNPAGLVGGVTNATKVVIWVAVLVAIPSIVSGILDTSSAISGFTGMVSWRDTNPIQEVAAASTPLGAAVKLVGCVFPIATVLNLFVLYVTAELFMTTFVYLLIFANKHITSY